MIRFRDISSLGKLIILESLILIVPCVIFVFFPDEIRYIGNFVFPSLVSIIIGFIIGYQIKNNLSGSRTVVIAWMYGFILAAVPFYMYHGLDIIQALFESVSSFTTTGFSILDVENIPKVYLLYRGFLQYVGGLGFVMTVMLFVHEKGSVVLYEAEGHQDKLMPNISKTVKVIVLMYISFLVIGTSLYAMAGMTIFDSVVHTMCALSTGGFSNKALSIGYYNSTSIEIISVILMAIGTTNFSLLLLLFKGRIREFFRSSEIRLLGTIILITVPLMVLFLIENNSLIESVKLAFFNIFSAISTTGFSTSDYHTWPETSLMIMIILMIIGGGIGSTSGGIKLGRVARILKVLKTNITKKFISQRTVTLTYYSKGCDKEILDDKQIADDMTYASTYIILFLIGTLALTYFGGYTIIEGAFEFASAIGTVGLSIGITNINTPSICLIIEIIGMILGRLEIFVIIEAIYKK